MTRPSRLASRHEYWGMAGEKGFLTHKKLGKVD